MALTSDNQQIAPEDLIKDQDTLCIKHKLMKTLQRNALLNSISDTAKFVAGPMFGVGLGMAMTALATGAAIAMPAIVVTIAALASAAVSVISGFMASRIYQGATFDNYEMNARSTAKHLVEQLKENSMCMTEMGEHEGNCRADGKQWAQVVKQDPAIARA